MVTANTPTVRATDADLEIHPAERLTLRDAWKAPTRVEPSLPELLAEHGDFSEAETALLIGRATVLIDRGCSPAGAVEDAVCELREGSIHAAPPAKVKALSSVFIEAAESLRRAEAELLKGAT